MITYGTNPNNNDTDNDGLTDYQEISTYNTSPNNNDTDNDGLTDYQEISTYNTSPNNNDTDNDGLTDYQEINTYNTSPIKADTDGDGFSDKQEILAGTDPLDPNSYPRQTTTESRIPGFEMYIIIIGLLAMIALFQIKNRYNIKKQYSFN
ncbi:MAG: binary toxin-like calcium binding domain-containing protein [Candidatus Helarchaeota archaeon]